MLPFAADLAREQVERTRRELDAATFEAVAGAAAQAQDARRAERETEDFAVLRAVAVPTDARAGIVADQ